jgi:O-antigen ligase
MRGLVFTYVLTFAGLFVSPFRPFVGLLVYVCFAIIKPDIMFHYSVPAASYSRMIFFALFIGWIIAGFGNRQFGRAALPAMSLALYLMWSVLSAWLAPDQRLAWEGVEEAAKIVITFLIGLTLIRSTTELRQLAWAICLAQGYLAYRFNVSYYDGLNELVLVGFAGMEEKTVAMTMVVTVPVALFLAFSTSSLPLKMVAGGLAALMIHVPIFTFARSGMLALLCAGAVAYWVVPKRPVHLLVLSCAVALGLRLAGPDVRSYFASSFAADEERDDSAQSRVELAGQAFETMTRHPVTGLGPKHWLRWSQSAYGWPSPKAAHNTWLEVGAEIGFAGTLALAAFFVLTVIRLYPLARSRAQPADIDETHFARMALTGLVGFLVATQFLTAHGVEVPYYVAMIGLGLLKITSPTPVAEPVRVPRPESAWLKPRASVPALRRQSGLR